MTCSSSYDSKLTISQTGSSFDGKAKIWSIDARQCLATHSESDKALWTAKWLPKIGRNESFAIAGATGGISFYREASGGS